MEHGLDPGECIPDAIAGREIADNPTWPGPAAEHADIASDVPQPLDGWGSEGPGSAGDEYHSA
jgi:hypothetical protein